MKPLMEAPMTRLSSYVT